MIARSLVFSLSLWMLPSVEGHGTMISPRPRQPESIYWYQVGCMIGCECSGEGKEDYPSLDSVNCNNPVTPTNTDFESLTFNAQGLSPRGSWNQYMPWRSPGSSKPIDSCGIASGFLPTAAVQYPHQFTDAAGIQQGEKGTLLPPGHVTRWEAGSIAEVSFYLVVNHGGGYQYRVCPKNSETMNESCFEQNPLVFADDYHTVYHGDRKIEIPTTDVSDGVIPEGFSWRRIPLPACNCDSGTNCAHVTDRDFDVAYAAAASVSAPKPYGNCLTGLQFVPPHIANGSWPEGYGYYLATLFSTDKGGSSSKNNAYKGTTETTEPCMSHTDSTECLADEENNCQWYSEKRVCYNPTFVYQSGTKGGDDLVTSTIQSPCASHSESITCLADKENNCKWYTEKNECYETRGVGNSGKEGSCIEQTNEASCLATTANGNKCTWYESSQKTVCYNNDSSGKGEISSKGNSDTSGRKEGEWHITDRVYAPNEPGEYILQWRWDNEQTPQIWTTCADIEVVPEGQLKEPNVYESSTISSIDSGASMPPRSSFSASILFLLATLSLSLFW